VRRLRIALPLIAGVLLLACVTEVVVGNLAHGSGDSVAPNTAVMVRPRFSGRDGDGKSFLIVGERGMADAEGEGRIRITAPVLTLKTAEGATKTMTARSGLYDEADHSLLLTGDVKMDSGTGTHFAAEQARIDTRSQTVSGQKGLQVAGAQGQVQSGSYTASDDGDRLILKGGVRGRLNARD
jgi:lipopolysaccharide export system protein LptC